MELSTYIEAKFKVSNLGNGPAISVDCIPALYGGPRGKEEIVQVTSSFASPINFVPINDEESQEVYFNFREDGGQKLIESLVKFQRFLLKSIVVYKNALGKPFKIDCSCWLKVRSKEDWEVLNSSLKTAKTADIEFASQIKEYERLKTVGRIEDSFKIMEEVDKKYLEISKGIREIELDTSIAYKGFTVASISEERYFELIKQKSKLEHEDKKGIHKCWEEHNYYLNNWESDGTSS